MLKWHKIIDREFESPIFEYYLNPIRPCVVPKIAIAHYSGGDQVIEAVFQDKEFYKACEQLTDIRLDSGLGIMRINYSASVNYAKTPHDKVLEFMELLKKHGKLDDQTCCEILQSLARKSETVIIDEINSLLEKEGVSAEEIKNTHCIAKNAQADGYHEAIWHLANALLANETCVSIETMIDVWESVSKENPHFKEANFELFGLYGSDKTLPTAEEKINILEKKLVAAIYSEQQTLIDQTFNELSGNKGLAMTIYKDLKGDAATLIALAKQIRTLSQENEKLKSYKLKAEATNATKASKRSGLWKQPKASGLVESEDKNVQNNNSYKNSALYYSVLNNIK